LRSLSFSLSLSLEFLRKARLVCTETHDAHIPTSLKPTTADPDHFHGTSTMRDERILKSRVISTRGTRGAASADERLDFQEISRVPLRASSCYVMAKVRGHVLRSSPLPAPARKAGQCARWPSKQYGR